MPRKSSRRVPGGVIANAVAGAVKAMSKRLGRPPQAGPGNRKGIALFKRMKRQAPQRRRRNVKNVSSTLGGLPSMSSFKLSRKPSKLCSVLKKAGAPNLNIFNDAYQVKIAEGQQGCAYFAYNSKTDLQQLFDRQGVTPVPGSGNAPRRLVIENSMCEYLITNSSLATMYVDIYDIVRKRDASGTNNQTSTPKDAWASGVYDQSSSNPLGFLAIHSSPFDSVTFRDYFKVIKRTRVGMSAGATHRHHLSLNVNTVMDTELLGSCPGDIKGLTVYTMLVAFGQPASLEADSGSIVTTAGGAIDIVRSCRIKYTWTQDASYSWFLNNNLSTLTGEKVITPAIVQTNVAV